MNQQFALSLVMQLHFPMEQYFIDTRRYSDPLCAGEELNFQSELLLLMQPYALWPLHLSSISLLSSVLSQLCFN